MGLVIFNNKPGRLVGMESGFEPARFRWSVNDWTSEEMVALVTNIQFTAQTNKQLSPTVGGRTHLYVFGNQPGALSLGGIAFDSSCLDDDRFSGFDQLLDYYESHKLSERKLPLEIVLGRRVLVAYLDVVNVMHQDPSLNTWTFNLSFIVIPDEKPLGKLRRLLPPEEPEEEKVAAVLPVPAFVMAADVGLDSGGSVVAGSRTMPVADPASWSAAADGTGPSLRLPRGFLADD